TIEEEVEGKNGSTYLMRLRPYRTVNNVIDGVVLTFQNITAMKELERQRFKMKDRILSFCQSIVNTVQESLLLLDDRFYVMFANEAFYSLFLTKEDETVGEKVFHLGNGQWDIKELRQLLENLMEKQDVIENYVVEHKFEDLGHRVMLLNGRKLEIEESEENILLLAIMDITNDPAYRKKNGI
ncbi:PAS domain-containing protein, partial [bacterium]|nr:PAS domain-containing protein [bacterium]